MRSRRPIELLLALALCASVACAADEEGEPELSSEAGVIGCSVAMGCGSVMRIVAIRLARLFPLNGGLPVTIS